MYTSVCLAQQFSQFDNLKTWIDENRAGGSGKWNQNRKSQSESELCFLPFYCYYNRNNTEVEDNKTTSLIEIINYKEDEVCCEIVTFSSGDNKK